jgi:hypothetical protein
MPELTTDAAQPPVPLEPLPSSALTADEVAQLRGFKVSDFDNPDGGTKVDLTTKEGREAAQKLIRDLKHGVETSGRQRNERVAAMEKALTEAGYDPKTLKRRETPPPATPATAVTADSVYAEMLKDPEIKTLVDENPEMAVVFKRQAAAEAKLQAGVRTEKSAEEPFSRAEAEVMLEWREAKGNPDYKRLAVAVGRQDFNAQDEFTQFQVGEQTLQAAHAAACEQKGEYIPVLQFLSVMSQRLLTAPPAPGPGAAPVNLAPAGGPQPPPAPGRPGAPAPAPQASLEQVAGMTDAEWANRQRTRFGASTEDQAFSLGGSDRREAILGGK